MEITEKKGIIGRILGRFDNMTIKGLLGSILIAFIMIVVLMSVSYIPGILSRISSSLSAALYSVFVPAEGATITTDKKNINSGDDFTITFKKGDLTNSIFAISYSCNNFSGVNLMSVETGGLKKITCDTPYYLLENENTIKIRAITQENIVRLAITGSYENNDTQKIETIGVARVTIGNSSVGTIVNTPAAITATSTITSPSISTPVSTTAQPTYVGKPDLAVRMLRVGLLNTGTNMITTQNQFSYYDMVGLVFEVRNDGDANAGPWSFTASLPSQSTPTYNSSTQISLRPGESIVFTLGFSNLINQYNGLITINVKSQGAASESNTTNNIVTQIIYNTGYNDNYYNNNNYGYYDVYGNYHNYNNYTNYNNTTLGVTCYGEPSTSNANDRVHWYAVAFGGDGSYSYDWSGTENLNSSQQNPSKFYSDYGIKYATVTVESDGYYVSHTCSVFVD